MTNAMTGAAPQPYDFYLKSFEQSDLTRKFKVSGTISVSDCFGTGRSVGSDARVTVQFKVAGPIAELVLADASAPLRKDELWKKTCFEVFATEKSDAYFEYNFSSSSQWAFYYFTDYRAGQARPEIATPIMKTDVRGDAECSFTYQFDLLHSAFDQKFGVTVVLEHKSGERSHWALTRAGAGPDFHQRASFLLSIDQLRKGT